MIYKTFEVALELKQTSTNPTFTVVEGDTGNRLKINVTDGGSPVDLTGCRVMAVFSKTNGIATPDSQSEGGGGIEIGGTYHNEVFVNIFLSSIAPGPVECELQIYSGELSEILITTARFNFKCNRAVISEGSLESTEEFPLLVELISTVQSFVGAEAEREAAEAVRQAEYQKWANAEAEAETLPFGHPATAELTEVGGKQIFKFGIPRGEGSGDMAKSVYDANGNGVVDNAERLGGKLPSEYQPKGNYASASIAVAVTLPVSDWSNNQQTVSVTGVTAANNIVVSPAPASRTAWSEAEIYCFAQASGKLTFVCTAVPSEAVTANVLIVG